MSDRTMQDVLTRLEAQEKELAQLRAARTRRSKFFVGRKRRTLSLGIIALLVALVPLSILAAGPAAPFVDRDQAAVVHQGDIDTIYNLGITSGFANPNDPSKPFYAPKQNVTREEMASFLARTASLNRIGFASLPSAAPSGDLGVTGPVEKPYMAIENFVVPGRAGSQAVWVKISFTGYVYARDVQGGPSLLRGDIRVDGETAGAAQIVTRSVVAANPNAIIGNANATPPVAVAERLDFSGSRVVKLAPGSYTFRMVLVREATTTPGGPNVGFGFGNMQAETIALDGTGTPGTP